MSYENNSDVAFIEEQLKENPDSVLFARLASLRLDENRIDEAIQICEEGLKKYPYYVTGHMILGKCYLNKKLYDQAEKEFKRVLLFDPKYLSAQKHYGDLMKEIGWENTCEMSYKKILQIDPLDELAQSMVDDFVIEGESIEDEVEAIETESELQETRSDLQKVAPITDDSEEEELLFREPEREDDVMVDETVEEPEIDDEKAEEFSYILEDIFKDEIAEKDIEEKKKEIEAIEEEIDHEQVRDPDHYLSELELPPTEREEEAVTNEEKVEASQEPVTEPERVPERERIVITDDDVRPREEKPEAEQKGSSVFAKSKKSDEQKIVTPTLGEIYAAQGQYSKAISVFETLLKKHPERKEYEAKINELKKKLNDS